MHPAIPNLLELQRLDLRIAALRTELESFPKRIKDADAMLNNAKAGVASAKEKHSHAQTERKKFELDVNQWRERARKYRDQSASVKTNEAYKAIQHEIAHAESEASSAEDRQLEQMMAVEETEREIKSYDREIQFRSLTRRGEKIGTRCRFNSARKNRAANSGGVADDLRSRCKTPSRRCTRRSCKRTVPWLRNAHFAAYVSGNSRFAQRENYSVRNVQSHLVRRRFRCGCNSRESIRRSVNVSLLKNSAARRKSFWRTGARSKARGVSREY